MVCVASASNVSSGGPEGAKCVVGCLRGSITNPSTQMASEKFLSRARYGERRFLIGKAMPFIVRQQIIDIDAARVRRQHQWRRFEVVI